MKYLLRKAMASKLPNEVLRQRKAGFGAPVDHWLANDLKEMTADLLGDSTLRNRGLFEPRSVQKMLTEHSSGWRDWSFQIWQLITLELWMRTFLDKSGCTVATSAFSLS